MIKFSCDNIVIEVREEVIKIFEHYRQGLSSSPEAGGVLLGKRLKNGNIIITDVYVFIIVGLSELRMWLLSKKSDIRQAAKL